MIKGNLPDDIKAILPDSILKVIVKADFDDEIEEIRLRLNKNIHIVGSVLDKLIFFDVTKEDIEGILNLATNYSFYANEDSLLKGFITMKGGHRIGFSGSVIMENNKVIGLRDINALNIRISRQIIGCSKLVLKYIICKDEVYNTLIISPPKIGKTTLLRDISREISTNNGDFRGKRVCIVDERKEIASLHCGVSELEVGDKTDVLEGINKSDGVNMLVRAMSPEVIITDEIGKKEDIYALENSVLSGVKVISSAHGKSMQDILKKDNFASLIKKRIFNRYIFLSIKDGKRYVKEIYNDKLERLM